MTSVLSASAVMGAIVLAIVQMVKSVIPDNRFIPLINVCIGIILGLAYAGTIIHGDIAVYAWGGGIAGLAAGGFYDLGANVNALNNSRKVKKMENEGIAKQDTNDGGQ